MPQRLEPKPSPTIQITKRYSQGYYADHPLVSQITPLVTPQPLAVGSYAVAFQAKDGALVQAQTLDIDSVRSANLAGGHQIGNRPLPLSHTERHRPGDGRQHQHDQ